jgi:hypothetical protein
MPPPPADEPDFDAHEAAQKHARRKACAILFGVFALLFALFAYAFIADEEPPDLSDLHIPRLNIPDEENAYAQLSKIALSLPPAAPEETDVDQPFALMANGEVAWDQAVMSAGLAHYGTDLVTRVDQALSLTVSESPECKNHDHTSPEIRDMNRLIRVLLLQASAARHAGDDTSAARHNLAVSHFGLRLTESRAPLIQVLVGIGIQSIALTAIREHADSLSESADSLRNYLAQTGGHEMDIKGLHLAYKLENRMFANATTQLKPADIAGFLDKPESLLVRIPGLYQPNRTLRWHAEIIRAMLTQADQPPPRGTPSDAALVLNRYTEAPWPGRLENLAGRTFLDIATPSSESFNRMHFRALADLRLTRLYLALRLYHLEHSGALPADLAELVPAYLPKIPLDPFDGQPLRYDREFTTIWATGPDRLNVTTAEGELPSSLIARRLLFARPSEPLPTFEEYQARRNTEPGLFGNP